MSDQPDGRGGNQSCLELDLSEHNYLKCKYFESIKSKYEETLAYIKTGVRTTPSPTPPPPSSTQVEAINPQNLRLRRQEVRVNHLHNTLQTATAELQEEKGKGRYEALKTKIETQWRAIQDLHEEIMVYETEFQGDYFENERFNDIEATVDKIIELFENKLAEMTTHKPNIPLPKIQLPCFSGGYEEWTTFHDVFQKTIHTNASLTRVEKMQYLKTHTRNEAAKLIQHLYITDGNYETAWELLCKRYHKRLIENKLIDQILDLPQLIEEDGPQLRNILNVVHECIEAISNLGINTDSWGVLIARIISQKWDVETNKLHELSLENPNEVQPLSTLMEFLERRCQSLEAIHREQKTNILQSFREDFKDNTCTCCQKSHSIINCPKFLQMSATEKGNLIKVNKLCYNCLRHESSKPCQSPYTCRKCDKKHHTLLHKEIGKSATHQESTVKVNSNFARMDIRNTGKMVLLTTALIQTQSAAGKTEYLRVLLDSGSQAAFMTERAAQLLGHPRQKISAEVTVLGDENPRMAREKIQTKITPRFSSDFRMNVSFYILPNLTRSLPDRKVSYEIPTEWQKHLLADPTFYPPGPIDAILGAEEVGKILEMRCNKTEDGLLGQETKLGWILSGCITEKQQQPNDYLISRVDETQQFTKTKETSEGELLPQENKTSKMPLEQQTPKLDDDLIQHGTSMQEHTELSHTALILGKKRITTLQHPNEKYQTSH